METSTCNWDAIAAIGSVLGAVATFIAAIVAWCIAEQWRGQKGSEVLSSICEECYKELIDLERLYDVTSRATKYQFRIWQLSKDREKFYNNQYTFEVDKLKSKVEFIENSLEIIMSYKNDDNNLKELVERFDHSNTCTKENLKEMCYYIGSYGHDSYVKENYQSYEDSLDMYVKESNDANMQLRKYLSNYIFHKR